MGDVVSMHTKQVVQTDHPPDETSVTDVLDENLMLDDEQVLDFIHLVGGLEVATTREDQRAVMSEIRQRVANWPDG